MAATLEDIKCWLEDAQSQKDSYLIVVCDTYDNSDYPVHVKDDEDIVLRIAEFDGVNMQRIMEVYDLSKDIDEQLSEHRAGGEILSLARQKIKEN